MSLSQTLRAVVSERLAAAAEDIFVLFERTIVEYEEELCRSREENQRKQQLLDKVLRLRTERVREKVHRSTSMSPGPSLNQEVTETPQIKEEPEEQSVKQEEEQLPGSVPESRAVCEKTEDSSLLQQRQTEHRQETQAEDMSSEPHFHPETDHWEPDAHGLHYSQVQTRDYYDQVQIRVRSTELSRHKPETTVQREACPGADRKKHQCFFCHKRFTTKQILTRHIRVHTGEKPFMCSVCMKTFTQKGHLDKHRRIHTGEKPYSCSVCNKAFYDSSNLSSHMRIHRHTPQPSAL